MNFFDEDTYWEASVVANKIAQEAAGYFNIDVKRVKNNHIKSFVENTKDVLYLEYNFGNHLGKMMLGSTQKINGVTVVAVSKKSIVERRFFSEMHETMHVYCDPITENSGRAFSELIIEGGYLPEDEFIEKRANYGASILMANDEALLDGLKMFQRFEQVANYFFMSKSAFSNRLVSYLVFNRNCTPNYAYKLLQNYKRGNNLEFFKVVYS